jgi:hypothetical protein
MAIIGIPGGLAPFMRGGIEAEHIGYTILVY